MAIHITDEQVAERDKWESMLIEDNCTLADALMMTLQSGAPASPYLIARIESAFQAYQYRNVEELAEPFGIAIGKREINAMEKKNWVSHVRFHVDGFHEKGFTKQDPSHFADTAFHEAGKMLHKSPTQIFDTYYER